jgi:hypothetical protein
MKVYFRGSVLEQLQEASEHAELRIVNDDGEWVSVSLVAGIAEISGSRPLVIRPRSGNVVTVRSERFGER